jgi:hypothetical protein
VRTLLVLCAFAVGIGASAGSDASWASVRTSPAGSSGLRSVAVASKSGPAALEVMRTAIRHGGSRSSLHYVSTSVGNGITTTIVGDVNRTSGTQTVVVKSSQVTSTVVVELVGHEAYFKGTATAIYVLLGLTPTQSAAAAGRWVSVVPADSTYTSTAAALTVGSVMSEITLSPPVTAVRNVVAGGRHLVEISGAWTGDGITAKEHATAELVVTPGARSLPVSFNGAVPDSASSGRFADNLTVSKWGEAVRVAAPASSVPLSAILKNTTTTTTTPPVVV